MPIYCHEYLVNLLHHTILSYRLCKQINIDRTTKPKTTDIGLQMLLRLVRLNTVFDHLFMCLGVNVGTHILRDNEWKEFQLYPH